MTRLKNWRTAAIAFLLVFPIAMAACSSSDSNADSDAESIQVSEAWIRPGIDPTAVYFKLTNSGDSAVTLVGADIDWAADVEMHETVDDDGFLMMQHLGSLSVPAGSVVSFEPGGMHLMATELRQDVDAGDRLVLVLLTDTGARIEFIAEAMGIEGDAAMGGDDHDHAMTDDAMSDDHGHADVEAHGALFSSGTIPPGSTFEFTFGDSLLGTEVPYHNHLDASAGTVMVMDHGDGSDLIEVTIGEHGFHPTELMVSPGTTVRWNNTTEVAWTVVNGYHPDDERGTHTHE